MLTAVKVTLLLPDYFLQEINYLFIVFVINSVTTFWLSHVLHLRGCMIREASKCRIRGYQTLFILKIIVLCILVVIGPFLEAVIHRQQHDDINFTPEFIMNCKDRPVYRKCLFLSYRLLTPCIVEQPRGSC